MRDLRCCDRCGRDTRNIALCGHCLSGKPSYVKRMGEQKGRSSRYARAINDKEEDDETADTRYHGDNYE